MNNPKTPLIISRPVLAVCAGLAISTACFAQAHPPGHESHMMVIPDDLKWTEVPSLPPGAKLAVLEGRMSEANPFTVRLRFPANYQIPAHSHPATERVTVLSGVFHMGTGDKLDRNKTRPLGPGSLAIMQPGSRHFAWTDQETIVQLNGIGPWGVQYVNPEDDPRRTKQ